MKVFNQNKNKATARMGLKLTALFAMLAPMALFANGTNGGISDSSLVVILVSMLVVQIALLYVISSVFKSLTANVSLWRKILPSGKVTSVIALLAMLTGTDVFAAGAQTSSFMLDSSLEMLLISVNAFLLFVIIVLLVNVKKITKALQASSDEEIVEADVFTSIGFTDAVPVEKEGEILLDHDYDGIHELDNNLPPWWLWGFYITIAWAFGYAWYYLGSAERHVGSNEFIAEMQVAADEAAVRGASVDESSVKLLTTEADLAAGDEIFQANCALCHKSTGAGDIGPNLTDDSWIHGGGIKDVFRTIKVGVPEKGMISWETTLSPTDMQKVASFVLSLQGSNPAGGKPPEGKKWVEEGAASAPVSETPLNLEWLTSEADLAAGQEIFKTNCAVCHLPSGAGSVGPNLTDEYWIHGGGVNDMVKLINVGVLEKGMVPWKGVLSPEEIHKVASFIHSLQGTNPEGGKAPEGDKWTGE